MAEKKIPVKVVVVTNYSDIAEAHQFIGLTRKGCDLLVMCPEDAPHFNLMKKNGVRLSPLKLRGKADLSGIRQIRKTLCRTRAGIIHMFNNRAVTNGLIASFGLPVKRVAYRGVAGREKIYSPYSWATYLNPMIHRVICVAEAIRQSYLTLGFSGVRFSSDRFVTVYKGHRLEWYETGPADLTQFGIPENAFVAGTIANMRKGNTKGIPELLKTASLIQDPDIHFLVVGNMQQELLDTYKDLPEPVRAKVHFTGLRKDAAALMAGVDVYVLPSVKNKEGLPKTVIEAMVQGVPPVVTRAGGSPELVVDQESGIIIPSGDPQAISTAVLRLKNNAAERVQMGQKARERIAAEFKCEKTVEKTMAVYRELVQSPVATAEKETPCE